MVIIRRHQWIESNGVCCKYCTRFFCTHEHVTRDSYLIFSGKDKRSFRLCIYRCSPQCALKKVIRYRYMVRKRRTVRRTNLVCAPGDAGTAARSTVATVAKACSSFTMKGGLAASKFSRLALLVCSSRGLAFAKLSAAAELRPLRICCHKCVRVYMYVRAQKPRSTPMHNSCQGRKQALVSSITECRVPREL